MCLAAFVFGLSLWQLSIQCQGKRHSTAFKGTNHYRVFVILQLQVLLFHKLSTLLNGPSTSSESDSNQFNTFTRCFKTKLLCYMRLLITIFKDKIHIT